VEPRLVRLMSRADTCVMFTPGTCRSSSAKFGDGAASICPVVITLIVAGAFTSFWSMREPLTTTVSSYFCGSSGLGGSLGGSGF
jgi:hypothetical protein